MAEKVDATFSRYEDTPRDVCSAWVSCKVTIPNGPTTNVVLIYGQILATFSYSIISVTVVEGVVELF